MKKKAVSSFERVYCEFRKRIFFGREWFQRGKKKSTLRSIITSVLDYLTIDSLPHVMRESNRSKEYRKLWAAHKHLALSYILREIDETVASRYDQRTPASTTVGTT